MDSALDPAQASIVGTHTFVLQREDGTFEVTAESTIRATANAFHISVNLPVTRNGKPFFHKAWTASEPRRLLEDAFRNPAGLRTTDDLDRTDVICVILLAA